MNDIAIWVMRGIGSCVYYGELDRVDLSSMNDAPIFVAKQHRDLVEGMVLFAGAKLNIIVPKIGDMHRVPSKQKVAGLSRPRYYLIGIHPNAMSHYKNHVGLKAEDPSQVNFTSNSFPQT